MFNSSSLPPNTPPTTMPRSQKEQDAASSLLDLQQSFSNTMQSNSGMNSPASSPTESNPNAHHVSSRQQPRGASTSINPSCQQVSHSPCYELIMLPPVFRQRESAVRSTLNRSLPVFSTLVPTRDDEEVRCESVAYQVDRHSQQGQVQASPSKPLKVPQARYHSLYQVHRSQQASPSSTHLPPPHPQPQVTPAQAFAHAQAQAYYLAHARVQTYGHPQQQQPSKQHHQYHQQQQPTMNHHVRAVENRSNSQPWPEPNSNRNSLPARANDPTSMQNSFSIRGNGVHVQRSILHENQVPTTPIPSCQHQATNNTSPQQQQQQQMAAFRPHKTHAQASQHKTAFVYGSTPPIAQQAYNHRESTRQHTYRQHQQEYEQAVYKVNQQQHHRHSLPHHHQQAVHQSKETSRQNREKVAQHESLPHRLSSAQQAQPPPQQEQRAITISPSTSSETIFTTEADQDEEMYELDDDDEDDEYFEEDEDDSDPEFQGTNRSKRHSGQSSSSGNSNHHQHGNNTNDGVSRTSNNNNKKGKSVKEKPRWTVEMRESLLKAVITYKNLDDMTSFHWSQIGKQVGRSGKACKDQWRRALLPKIQHTFDRCDQDFNTGTPGASSLPTSLQPQQQRNNKQ